MSESLKPAQEHELKVWPEFFDAIQDGSKPFEIRIDDRGFAVGDSLWFREFDPRLVIPSYTGREMRWIHTISYMIKGAFGLPANVAVMGLRTRPTPQPAPRRLANGTCDTHLSPTRGCYICQCPPPQAPAVKAERPKRPLNKFLARPENICDEAFEYIMALENHCTLLETRLGDR